MKHTVSLFVMVLAAINSIVPLSAARAGESAPTVRVMSYNVRVGTAPDGVNAWDKRKAFLAATIRAFHPDLLGTQETLGFQRDYLADQLPGYAHLGVGRDDGKEAGEMMALYYRSDRFEELASGNFWLSPTPDKPGSKGWDAAFPRMVTWVKLRDRLEPDAAPILFLDTHLDYKGPVARIESISLIRQRLALLAAGCVVVLTGDFNSGEDDAPYRSLFGAGADPQLRDSYRIAHPRRQAHEGTFTGFAADARDSARIDWIAVSTQWRVLAAHIDRAEHDGRTPSDHFAVTAVLQRSTVAPKRSPATAAHR